MRTRPSSATARRRSRHHRIFTACTRGASVRPRIGEIEAGRAGFLQHLRFLDQLLGHLSRRLRAGARLRAIGNAVFHRGLRGQVSNCARNQDAGARQPCTRLPENRPRAIELEHVGAAFLHQTNGGRERRVNSLLHRTERHIAASPARAWHRGGPPCSRPAFPRGVTSSGIGVAPEIDPDQIPDRDEIDPGAVRDPPRSDDRATAPTLFLPLALHLLQRRDGDLPLPPCLSSLMRSWRPMARSTRLCFQAAGRNTGPVAALFSRAFYLSLIICRLSQREMMSR